MHWVDGVHSFQGKHRRFPSEAQPARADKRKADEPAPVPPQGTKRPADEPAPSPHTGKRKGDAPAPGPAPGPRKGDAPVPGPRKGDAAATGPVTHRVTPSPKLVKAMDSAAKLLLD